MGSRHNRKRVRSRPRYRKKGQNFEDISQYSDQQIADISSDPWNPGFSPVATYQLAHPNANQVMNDFQPLQSRTNSTTSSPGPGPQLHWQNSISPEAGSDLMYDTKMEEARMQMFGGEHGDEVGLCGDMLRVVMGLFDGNVDYED